MDERVIGRIYILQYPNFGTPDSFPDYTAHSGQRVMVISHSGADLETEMDCGERMYYIAANDGWEGHAWASELVDIPCKNHPNQPSVSVLDGDYLCQKCSDRWVKGEGKAELEC